MDNINIVSPADSQSTNMEPRAETEMSVEFEQDKIPRESNHVNPYYDPTSSQEENDLAAAAEGPGHVGGEAKEVVQMDEIMDGTHEDPNNGNDADIDDSSSASSETSDGDSSSESDIGEGKPQFGAFSYGGMDFDEDEDEETGAAASGPLKTKNELTLPPVEPVDVVIPESAVLEKIGHVFAIVEDMVVIQATMSGDLKVLDEGSVICFEDRTPLGKIFDTFGPVQQPLYSVRLPPNVDRSIYVKERSVFYWPDAASFVFTAAIKNKGSDASNVYDEEVAEDEMEFSDDEMEREHKLAKKKEKKGRKSGKPEADSHNKSNNNSQRPFNNRRNSRMLNQGQTTGYSHQYQQGHGNSGSQTSHSHSGHSDASLSSLLSRIQSQNMPQQPPINSYPSASASYPTPVNSPQVPYNHGMSGQYYSSGYATNQYGYNHMYPAPYGQAAVHPPQLPTYPSQQVGFGYAYPQQQQQYAYPTQYPHPQHSQSTANTSQVMGLLQQLQRNQQQQNQPRYQ